MILISVLLIGLIFAGCQKTGQGFRSGDALDGPPCGGVERNEQLIDKTTSGERYFNVEQCSQNCDTKCLGYCKDKNDGDIAVDCEKAKKSIPIPTIDCNPNSPPSPPKCMDVVDRNCVITESWSIGSNYFVKNNWYGGITCMCNVRGTAKAYVSVYCKELTPTEGGKGSKPT